MLSHFLFLFKKTKYNMICIKKANAYTLKMCGRAPKWKRENDNGKLSIRSHTHACTHTHQCQGNHAKIASRCLFSIRRRKNSRICGRCWNENDICHVRFSIYHRRRRRRRRRGWCGWNNAALWRWFWLNGFSIRRCECSLYRWLMDTRKYHERDIIEI